MPYLELEKVGNNCWTHLLLTNSLLFIDHLKELKIRCFTISINNYKFMSHTILFVIKKYMIIL